MKTIGVATQRAEHTVYRRSVSSVALKSLISRQLRCTRIACPADGGKVQDKHDSAEQATKPEVRRRKAFGEWLLETEDPSLLEQPPEKDFWEGPQWDFIGKTAGFIVPLIVVLSLLVGLFAAGSYNNGATQVLQPASSPEDTGKIFTPEAQIQP